MLTWLLVITRVIANPVSNVFQKGLAQRAADPIFIICATHALLSLVCLPLLAAPLRLGVGTAFWVNIAITAVLAVAGNVLLVYALKSSDLSVLGPINSYKPLISLVLGVFLIGEVPTAAGLMGMLLILAGSYFVVDRNVSQPRQNVFLQFFRARGVQLRFMALALSATEAVFLKRALLLSSPLTTFVLWCLFGLPVALLAFVLLRRERVADEVAILRANWSTYLWLALTTGLMQCTTIFTFGKLPVGYSLALFQMSAIISVLLGYRYFQERNIRKRLFAAVIMAAGAILIVLFGVRA